MTKNLEDLKINVKYKLSALWASVMFLYIYADYFGLFLPGHIEDLISGEIEGMEISQELLLVFMILMAIPSLMIFLSLELKAKFNRQLNVIVGILQLGLVLPSGIDPNIFFAFASLLEAVLLVLIIWYAWNWPIQNN